MVDVLSHDYVPVAPLCFWHFLEQADLYLVMAAVLDPGSVYSCQVLAGSSGSSLLSGLLLSLMDSSFLLCLQFQTLTRSAFSRCWNLPGSGGSTLLLKPPWVSSIQLWLRFQIPGYVYPCQLLEPTRFQQLLNASGTPIRHKTEGLTGQRTVTDRWREYSELILLSRTKRQR